MKAPVAKIFPRELEAHGRKRIDPYYWLRERDDPEVLAYLEAENAHTEAGLAHTKDLQEEIFKEIKGRLKPDDQSVPYRRDDYFYYSRFEAGREYAIHCRKRETLASPEEILIDGNELAEGQAFFALKLAGISTDQNLLAYAVDTQGRRIYQVRFKQLDSGEILEDVISDVTGNLAWANDNRTILYSRQDPKTLRSHRIFRHQLGTKGSEDELVYEEEDETFSTYVFKSKSKQFLFIASHHTLSTEVRFFSADDPRAEPEIVLAREREHEYAIDHQGEFFYLLTNKDAKNFRLVRAPIGKCKPADWEEVLPHREQVLLEDFELFRTYLVVVERRDGLRYIRVLPRNGEPEHELAFEDPTYFTYLTHNLELDTEVLRYGYTSLTTPHRIFDHDMRTGESMLLKQDEVRGGFDRSRYRSERIEALAPDGKAIPISLVYREDVPLEGASPLLLFAYGSYGHTMDASFSSTRLSLLDRGFVYAIAHVRGGELMGRQWYEEGKLLKKRNTFTDFIACGEHLLAQGYADPAKLYARGGSAGGLLIGAVINLRPDLFQAAVAEVPFVDIITTMLDDSLPLTTGEYDEWGNPYDQTFYDYMLSYSPYDNLEAKDYPHLLVTAGFHDSQVQYWEPAKWVAKLRALKTDGNRLYLKTNMEAGHSGTSGRFKQYRETALVYAFLLDVAGTQNRGGGRLAIGGEPSSGGGIE